MKLPADDLLHGRFSRNTVGLRGANVRRVAFSAPYLLSGDILQERSEQDFMLDDRSERGRQASAVGTAITRLHRENYGRVATTTRAVFQGNYVIAFLEDIYTPMEKTLLKDGRHEAVKETRQHFQMAMRAEFTAAVEEITGRKVIQFMSQVAFEPDMAAEIFVLEPEAGERVEEGSVDDR
jgi:uncharacterized protein YbcI